MKIGIVTLYKNNKNYGGLLQAYALSRVLTETVGMAEIVDYQPSKGKYVINRMKNIGLKNSCRILMNKIRTNNHYRKNPELKRLIDNRNALFDSFEISIPHSNVYTDVNLCDLGTRYNALVCGSDQIWNPGLWNPVMFLDINGFKGRRISYAASIGRNQLTESEKKFISKHISGLECISVREESAYELLTPIVNKEISIVADPTLLVDMSKWGAIAVRPDGVPDNFVFSFFLGENKDVKKWIHDKYSSSCSIVTIPHLQTGYKVEDEVFSDIQLYNVGPKEWIWLIMNAQCVYTDSFHGTAFSVNFNKIFVCFPKGIDKDRQSINSRLVDLLSKLNLSERFVRSVSDIDSIVSRKIDWTSTNDVLSEWREQSLTYLRKGLINAG